MCVWTSITPCAERPKKRFTRHWQTGYGVRSPDGRRRARRGPRAARTVRRGQRMCLVHARVGSGLRSCACANSTVRLQCARPFTTDTLRSCCTAALHNYKSPALCHSNTHHWSARHVYPRRTILSPGFKTVSKVTLGRPPACRLRWPRCRGAGGGLAVP